LPHLRGREPPGHDLDPGLYKSTSTLEISSGTVTLSGVGVFIFQIASGLTVTSGAGVVLSGGAQASDIFWQVGSSATIGTTATMDGTIMAYASVTLDTGAHLNGQALARTGDVTLVDDTIVASGGVTSGGTPLSPLDWVVVGAVVAGGVAALAAVVMKGRAKSHA